MNSTNTSYKVNMNYDDFSKESSESSHMFKQSGCNSYHQYGECIREKYD